MSEFTAEASPTQSQSTLFKLKGSRISVSVLELYDYDYERFNADLEGAVASAPQLFQKMPVVISLEHMTHDSYVDFIEMCQLLNEFGLSPVAISGGSEEQQVGASVAGLAKIDRAGSAKSQSSPAPSSTTATDTAPTESKTPKLKTGLITDFESPMDSGPVPTKIIRHPIRSGQQIYAKDTDLIVIGSVSQGAEILADGNIHVYGPLRGRALAGVRGNTDSMIFCSQLQAELVSIAGTYKVIDDIRQTRWQRAAMIRLDRDQLIVESQ